MKIVLKDEDPVFQNPTRMSASENQLTEEICEKLLADGISSESSSDFASPVVLANKKDGTKRICINYKKLCRELKSEILV
jgi:hypothetical protein